MYHSNKFPRIKLSSMEMTLENEKTILLALNAAESTQPITA